MGRNNRVDAQDDDDDYDDVFERKNKDLLNSLNIKLKLNYFPNDQTKHIDYVIYYEDKPNIKNKEEKKEMREKIKKLIENEGFDIHQIEWKSNKQENSKSIYLLLNCSLERLMQEAERMHLEIPLKDVSQSLKKKLFN